MLSRAKHPHIRALNRGTFALLRITVKLIR